MSDVHPTQHPLDGKLEPETKDCFDDRAPLYSIAISLKRIADALDGNSAEAGIKHAIWGIAQRPISS